jgi:adenosylcobinamide-phosphate synthase
MINSFKTALRDGRKNPSPNSGIPEAAMAGALGVRLGGLNYYHAVATPKPFIGDEKRVLEPGHIQASLRVAYVSSFLSLGLGLLLL